MKDFKTFLGESKVLTKNASTVSRALRNAGIGFSVDNSKFNMVIFEIEHEPGLRIVVDSVNVEVKEYGSTEFLDMLNPASLKKVLELVEE